MTPDQEIRKRWEILKQAYAKRMQSTSARLSYDWRTDHEVKRAVEWLADLGYVEDQNGSYRLTPMGQDLYESIEDETNIDNPDQDVLRKYLTRKLHPIHPTP